MNIFLQFINESVNAFKFFTIEHFNFESAKKVFHSSVIHTVAFSRHTLSYVMMDPNRRDISIITIKKFCDGLDITLGEFFSTPEFDELEQEIK